MCIDTVFLTFFASGSYPSAAIRLPLKLLYGGAAGFA